MVGFVPCRFVCRRGGWRREAMIDRRFEIEFV
jgi:hypothetical protein